VQPGPAKILNQKLCNLVIAATQPETQAYGVSTLVLSDRSDGCHRTGRLL